MPAAAAPAAAGASPSRPLRLQCAAKKYNPKSTGMKLQEDTGRLGARRRLSGRARAHWHWHSGRCQWLRGSLVGQPITECRTQLRRARAPSPGP